MKWQLLLLLVALAFLLLSDLADASKGKKKKSANSQEKSTSKEASTGAKSVKSSAKNAVKSRSRELSSQETDPDFSVEQISEETNSREKSKGKASKGKSKARASKTISEERASKTKSKERASKTKSKERASTSKSRETASKNKSKKTADKTKSKETVSKSKSEEKSSNSKSKKRASESKSKKTSSQETVSKSRSKRESVSGETGSQSTECQYVEPESGICYWKTDDHYTQAEAKIECEINGGQLATVDSQAKSDFVVEQRIISGDVVWIDIKYSSEDQTYYWADNVAATWTNWLSLTPSQFMSENNPCVMMADDGIWTTSHCDGKFFGWSKIPGLCQKVPEEPIVPEIELPELSDEDEYARDKCANKIGGIFGLPNECFRYVECGPILGEYKVESCPRNTQFDEGISQCKAFNEETLRCREEVIDIPADACVYEIGNDFPENNPHLYSPTQGSPLTSIDGSGFETAGTVFRLELDIEFVDSSPASPNSPPVITCEGHEFSLQCLESESIHIVSVNYGRTISEHAPEGVCPYSGRSRDKTDCHSDRASSIVNQFCNGRSACSFNANNGVLGGDPCGGTYKYLNVTYRCDKNVDSSPAPPNSPPPNSPTPNSPPVITCEGHKFSLQCLESESIHIVSVNYGRTISEHAPEGVCPYSGRSRDKTDCHSDGAASIVNQFCNGRSACSFNANNGVMGGDPCGGTYKYLNVTYSCDKNVDISVAPTKPPYEIICEGNEFSLQCLNSQSIHILSVNYGRTISEHTPERICPYSGTSLDKTDCHSDRATAIVNQFCNGQITCSFNANNHVLGGDPCLNTYKYLNVTYTCDDTEPFSPTLVRKRRNIDDTGCQHLDPTSGICYWDTAGVFTQAEAKQACLDQGGELAVIDSQEKADFVVAQNVVKDISWLNLEYSIEDSTYYWPNKVKPTWTNWALYGPAEYLSEFQPCIIMSSDGIWTTSKCSGAIFGTEQIPGLCQQAMFISDDFDIPHITYDYLEITSSVCPGEGGIITALDSIDSIHSIDECKFTCDTQPQCSACECQIDAIGGEVNCNLISRTCEPHGVLYRDGVNTYIKTGSLILGVYRPVNPRHTCQLQLVHEEEIHGLYPGLNDIALHLRGSFKVNQGDKLGFTSQTTRVVTFTGDNNNAEASTCNLMDFPQSGMASYDENGNGLSEVSLSYKAHYLGDVCPEPPDTTPTCNPQCGINEDCVLEDSHYVCQCKDEEPKCGQGCVKPSKLQCVASGDPHYRTYDGAMIHFMGTCVYTLSATKQNTTEDNQFAVLVQAEHRHGNTRVSYVKEVTVILRDQNGDKFQIVFSKNGHVKVEGTAVNLPQSINLYGGKVASLYLRNGRDMVVKTSFGVTVVYNGVHWVAVNVPPQYCGELEGLCGNANGNKEDDYTTRTEISVLYHRNKYSQIGNSWLVDSIHVSGCVNPTTDISIPEIDDPESECNKLLDLSIIHPHYNQPNQDDLSIIEELRNEYMTNCEIDISHADDENKHLTLCRIIEAFEKEIKTEGFKVELVDGDEWREFLDCPMVCPSDMIYSSDAPVCLATCAEPNAPAACQQPNEAVCHCAHGTYLLGNRCLIIEDCLCTANTGDKYAIGERWLSDDCTTQYLCEASISVSSMNHECLIGEQCDGKGNCEPEGCPAGFEMGENGCQTIFVDECALGTHTCADNAVCKNIEIGTYYCKCPSRMVSVYDLLGNHRCENKFMCMASGDPHYRNFDGKKFNFMGTCLYKLSEVCDPVPNFPNFIVKNKNEHRRSNTRVSYVQYVTLEMYSLHIKLDTDNSVYVNGTTVTLPFVGSDLEIDYKGGKIVVTTNVGLRLAWNSKGMVRIYIPEVYTGHVCGMCGNADGDSENDMITPDHTETESHVEFGDSWMIPDPDATEGCMTTLPEDPECSAEDMTRFSENDMCGIIKNPEGPFQLAVLVIDPTDAFDDCVMDNCLDSDVGSDRILCASIEYFVEIVQHTLQETFQWRSEIDNLYGIECAMDCDADTMEYTTSMKECQPTCYNPNAEDTCDNEDIIEGCKCKDGYLLEGNECVPMDTCGCMIDSEIGAQYFPLNAFWVNENCTKLYQCVGFENIQSWPMTCLEEDACKIVDGVRDCYCYEENIPCSIKTDVVPIDEDNSETMNLNWLVPSEPGLGGTQDDNPNTTTSTTTTTAAAATPQLIPEGTTQKSFDSTFPAEDEKWDYPIIINDTVVVLPRNDDDDENNGYFQLEPEQEPLKPHPLGVESCMIPEEAFSASSFLTNGEPHKVRPIACSNETPSGWMPDLVFEDRTRQPGDVAEPPFLQVDFGQITPIHGIGTLGHYFHDCFIESYELHVSEDNSPASFQPVLNNTDGSTLLFTGNSDQNTWKRHCLHRILGSPVWARYVRIVPRNTAGRCIGLRLEFYGFRDADDSQLISALKKDAWTRNVTGCMCYFDHSRTDCACCYDSGCQCYDTKHHQCVQCGYSHNCGIPEINEIQNQVDPWTQSESGCTCDHDKTSQNCACCKRNGCQCGQVQPNQCVNCGAIHACAAKPHIFGPPSDSAVCVPTFCPLVVQP